tara:strand:- start:2867 stop:3139 length:273 start_codon:yes stop_codon:yes gene_type:complete
MLSLFKRGKMELMSLKGVSADSKIQLLKEIGYSSDGEIVLDLNGDKVLDRYLEIPIKIENMVIIPFGSITILDDNELSLSKFMEEFGDVF